MAEFEEDMQGVRLENAKIYYLQRFYDLEIEHYNETNILVGIMAALCFARTCSYEDVVRVVLTGGGLADNSFMAEFERYDLLDAFWKLCEQHFGYTDVNLVLVAVCTKGESHEKNHRNCHMRCLSGAGRNRIRGQKPFRSGHSGQ